MDKVQELEKDGKEVSRFSVTGYSLGGLVGRYVIGILHQRKFFENVTPINFNTVATPNLGLVSYRSLISRITSSLGPKLLSRTGEQFYCVDRWSRTGRPLLDVMADPSELAITHRRAHRLMTTITWMSDRIFFQALALFKHIRIYANAYVSPSFPRKL